MIGMMVAAEFRSVVLAVGQIQGNAAEMILEPCDGKHERQAIVTHAGNEN